MNYSIQEYVNDAVSSIVDACEKNELPQPNIITESGRSLTAHHSVLVFEALASTSLPAFDENEDLAEDAHELVKELRFHDGNAGGQAMGSYLVIIAVLIIFFCIRRRRRTAAVAWQILNRCIAFLSWKMMKSLQEQ